MVSITWICLFVVAYHYVGYPALVWLLARLRPRPTRQGAALPTMSLIVAAYNEAEVIAAKVENSLALDYPPERLEIIFVTDGSDDGTPEIVAAHRGQGVRLLHQPRRQGKSAAINRAGRFESLSIDYDPGEEPGRVRTQFLKDDSQSIISRHDSPDLPFEASLNPYRGCEHGCAYCYARPTHEFLGFSAGVDFESRILVKHRAAELLEAELRRANYQPKVLSLSGVTDPYQPVERELRITRSCLEVLAAFRHPKSAVTAKWRPA